MQHDVDAVTTLLRSRCGLDARDVAVVGAGAWSTAYGFHVGDRQLVVRVGDHLDDFEADRDAAFHRSSILPIPAVHDIGPFETGYYCVSNFAPGKPIETCTTDEWSAIVPSLVDALEAMRRCEPPHALTHSTSATLTWTGRSRTAT